MSSEQFLFQPRDILTPQEAAQLVGCPERTLKKLLRERALPGIKLGNRWRVPRAALLERLNLLAELHVANGSARTVDPGITRSTSGRNVAESSNVARLLG